MFGFARTQTVETPERRRIDGTVNSVDHKVLAALEEAARHSSPHRAAQRANIARTLAALNTALDGHKQLTELTEECERECQATLLGDGKSHPDLCARYYSQVLVEWAAVSQATERNGRTTSFTGACVDLPIVNLGADEDGMALPDPDTAFATPRSITQLIAHLGMVRDRLAWSARLLEAERATQDHQLTLLLAPALVEKSAPEQHNIAH